MDVLGTVGSFFQRMQSGMKFSEEKRIAADDRVNEVREHVKRQLRNRPNRGMTLSDFDIDVQANRVTRDDQTTSDLVGGEQWGQRLTVMYGVAHLASAVNITNRHLTELVTQQAATIELLQQVLDELRNTKST